MKAQKLWNMLRGQHGAAHVRGQPRTEIPGLPISRDNNTGVFSGAVPSGERLRWCAKGDEQVPPNVIPSLLIKKPDDLIHPFGAAKHLGVDAEAIWSLIRRGKIVPWQTSEGYHVSLKELRGKL